MLPPEKSHKSFANLIYAYLAPLESLWVAFCAYMVIYNEEIKVNGQVLVLQQFLNLRFDKDDMRIVINTGADSQELLLFPDDVTGQSVLFDEVLFSDDSVYANLYDFEVVVPNSVLTAVQIAQLKNYVNHYKIAGTRPRYRQENGTII